MYETDDNLTLAQANEFIRLHEKHVGTDYELNPSPSGEPDRYYIFVVDLEEEQEYKRLRWIEAKVTENK